MDKMPCLRAYAPSGIRTHGSLITSREHEPLHHSAPTMYVCLFVCLFVSLGRCVCVCVCVCACVCVCVCVCVCCEQLCEKNLVLT